VKVRTIKRLRMLRRPQARLVWMCLGRWTEVRPLGGEAYVFIVHPDLAADLRAADLLPKVAT
jgi:hypothetical protein